MAETKSPEEGLVAAVQARQDGKSQSQLANRPLDSDVVDYISTQAPSLDLAIGRQGIPSGRLTVLVGKPKAGKSTVGYHLLQETQRRGGFAVLIDAERRYSRDRGERIGIDHDRLIYMPGRDVDATFKELQAYVAVVREKWPDRLVTFLWDSMSGTPLEAELKDEGVVAGHAKLVGKWFRVLLPEIAQKHIAFVIVAQLRSSMDIGGGTYFSQGSSDTMLADRALNYHCSVKIHFTQIAKIPAGEKNPTGITVRAKVEWNTVAPPFRTAVMHINFKDGIDRDACAFEVAKDLELVKQNANWWSYGDEKFQRNKWPEVLHRHEELQKLIEEAPLNWIP